MRKMKSKCRIIPWSTAAIEKPVISLGTLQHSTSQPHHLIFFLLQKIDAQAIEEFYGLTSDISKNSESGYILFYQSRDWAGQVVNPQRTVTQQRGEGLMAATGSAQYAHISIQALFPVGGALHWSVTRIGWDVCRWHASLLDYDRYNPLSPHCNKHLYRKRNGWFCHTRERFALWHQLGRPSNDQSKRLTLPCAQRSILEGKSSLRLWRWCRLTNQLFRMNVRDGGS